MKQFNIIETIKSIFITKKDTIIKTVYEDKNYPMLKIKESNGLTLYSSKYYYIDGTTLYCKGELLTPVRFQISMI